MTGTAMPRLNVDSKFDLAYLTLSDAPVVRTVEFNHEVIVDLDEMNMVVGIEFLATGARIPLSDMQKRFHISQHVVNSIAMLLPSIKRRISITSGVDSTTKARMGATSEIVRH